MYLEVRVVVICHGGTERVRQLARAVREGASEAGAQVRVRRVAGGAPAGTPLAGTSWPPGRFACRRDVERVDEATVEDLDWADVALFGTPAPHAAVAPELKRLIDAAGPLRKAGRLARKVYGVFAPATPAPRGAGTRLLALSDVFHAWQGHVVPPRCAGVFERSAGRAEWTLHVAAEGAPSEAELAAARCHGRRATEAALALGAQRRVLPEVA